MKAKELHRILSQALLFAGKDQTLPMLCGVKLKSGDNRLWAAATDRFTAGIAHTEFTGDSGAIDVFLNRSAVTNVIKLAKGGVRDERTVVINSSDDGIVSFDFSDGGTVRIQDQVQNFPAIGQLFDQERNEFDDISFDPAFIERIGKAGKLSDKGPLVWRFHGNNKPAVAFKNDFAALIMPKRLAENEATLPVESIKSIIR